METSIRVAFGVFTLVLLFLPATLLVLASVKVFRSIGSYSAVLIALGALLLTIGSLDFLFMYVIAFLYGPEELAAFALYTTYIFRGLNLLALLLIGFGLIVFCNRARFANASPR